MIGEEARPASTSRREAGSTDAPEPGRARPGPRTRRSALASLGILPLIFVASGPSLAADAYPAPGDPVTIVVGATPGGATEVVGRFVADVITQRLKGTAVVEFRTGAGGAVAAEYVARSKPNGHTLLVASQSALSVIPLVVKNVRYDVARDFSPISLIASSPMVLLTSLQSRISTPQQLIQELKSRPGALNFGSSGNGTSLHLTAEAFLSSIGASARHVAYKGAGQALIDLGGGTIDWMFDLMPTGVAFARTNRAVPLAVTSAERSGSAPDLPTLRELGVDFTWATWLGVVAPVGTPEHVLDSLNREIAAALKIPEMAARLAKSGFDLQPSGRKEFADYIANETRRFARIVEDAKITAD
jgi:tripartite-type tricarboxylate transporter receptor subunit TctC